MHVRILYENKMIFFLLFRLLPFRATYAVYALCVGHIPNEFGEGIRDRCNQSNSIENGSECERAVAWRESAIVRQMLSSTPD